MLQVFAVWRGGDLPHWGALRPPNLRFGFLLRTPFFGAHCIFTNHLQTVPFLGSRDGVAITYRTRELSCTRLRALVLHPVPCFARIHCIIC